MENIPIESEKATLALQRAMTFLILKIRAKLPRDPPPLSTSFSSTFRFSSLSHGFINSKKATRERTGKVVLMRKSCRSPILRVSRLLRIGPANMAAPIDVKYTPMVAPLLIGVDRMETISIAIGLNTDHENAAREIIGKNQIGS